MPVLAINGPPTVSLSNDAEEAGLAADGAGLAAAGLAAAGAAGTARLASVKITVAAAIATKARLTSGFIGVPLMYLVEGSAAAPRPRVSGRLDQHRQSALKLSARKLR